MKATAGLNKLCDSLPKPEKENFVVDLLSLTTEFIKLLSHVNFFTNKKRSDKIKN